MNIYLIYFLFQIRKPNTYNSVKNLVEVEVERKMHVFANEFFTDTYVEFQ